MILNFREENIRDPKSSHKIHENIVLELYGIGALILVQIPRMSGMMLYGMILPGQRGVLPHSRLLQKNLILVPIRLHTLV